MFILTHENEGIGMATLDRGDPAAYSVSGVFNNLGGCKAMAGWIRSIGGEEDDGVVFIALNKDFALFDQAGNTIEFAEGHLMAVPEEDEVYIDISGLSAEDYKTYFSAHITAMEDEA